MYNDLKWHAKRMLSFSCYTTVIFGQKVKLTSWLWGATPSAARNRPETAHGTSGTLPSCLETWMLMCRTQTQYIQYYISDLLPPQKGVDRIVNIFPICLHTQFQHPIWWTWLGCCCGMREGTHTKSCVESVETSATPPERWSLGVQTSSDCVWLCFCCSWDFRFKLSWSNKTRAWYPGIETVTEEAKARLRWGPDMIVDILIWYLISIWWLYTVRLLSSAVRWCWTVSDTSISSLNRRPKCPLLQCPRSVAAPFFPGHSKSNPLPFGRNGCSQHEMSLPGPTCPVPPCPGCTSRPKLQASAGLHIEREKCNQKQNIAC